MGMFDGFQNLQNNYTPTNTSCDTVITSKQPIKPYEEYNDLGELVGYFWYYGDSVNLEFNITGEVSVEENCIIYNTSGATPSTTTIGTLNEKAYNIIDQHSWTCTQISGSTYTWTLDSTYVEPTSGNKTVYFTADDYVKDKYISFTLYNFRNEPIYIKTFNGSTQIIVNTNETFKDKDGKEYILREYLAKGIYYCALRLFNQDNELVYTLFDQDTYTLNIK